MSSVTVIEGNSYEQNFYLSMQNIKGYNSIYIGIFNANYLVHTETLPIKPNSQNDINNYNIPLTIIGSTQPVKLTIEVIISHTEDAQGNLSYSLFQIVDTNGATGDYYLSYNAIHGTNNYTLTVKPNTSSNAPQIAVLLQNIDNYLQGEGIGSTTTQCTSPYIRLGSQVPNNGFPTYICINNVSLENYILTLSKNHQSSSKNLTYYNTTTNNNGWMIGFWIVLGLLILAIICLIFMALKKNHRQL